jgi:hypothetical protein
MKKILFIISFFVTISTIAQSSSAISPSLITKSNSHRNGADTFLVPITAYFNGKVGGKRVGNTIYGLVDEYTGEAVTFQKLSSVTDADVDNVLVWKKGNEYFKRVFKGPIDVRWFGAKGDGVSDNTTVLRKVFARFKQDLGAGNTNIYFPEGVYLTDTLATKNSVSNLTFYGDGPRRTIIAYNGVSGVGKSFITLINAQSVVFKDLTLRGNNTYIPKRMIEVQRQQHQIRGPGTAQNVQFHNIQILGDDGAFKRGISFTSNGYDANNEQSLIFNCRIEFAKEYAISFEHANSLWHKIIGCRLSGDSAAITNIKDDGTSGGSFSLYNTILFPSYSTHYYLLKLTSAYYPIHIEDCQSESFDKLLYAKGRKTEISLTNCTFTTKKDSIIKLDGTGIQLSMHNTKLLCTYGVFIYSCSDTSLMKNKILILGGGGNINRIEGINTDVDMYGYREESSIKFVNTYNSTLRKMPTNGLGPVMSIAQGWGMSNSANLITSIGTVAVDSNAIKKVVARQISANPNAQQRTDEIIKDTTLFITGATPVTVYSYSMTNAEWATIKVRCDAVNSSTNDGGYGAEKWRKFFYNGTLEPKALRLIDDDERSGTLSSSTFTITNSGKNPIVQAKGENGKTIKFHFVITVSNVKHT